jgi:hypothetical protein
MGFNVTLCGSNSEPLMSALGQKWILRRSNTMSALPPKADMVQHDSDVRFVPKAGIRDNVECERKTALRRSLKGPSSTACGWESIGT